MNDRLDSLEAEVVVPERTPHRGDRRWMGKAVLLAAVVAATAAAYH